MPGPWYRQNPPKRPGAYVNWQATARPTPLAPQQGVVCIPFTHDWGPFKEVVELSSMGEYFDVFGSSTDTPGYRAVLQAFKGEGIDGQGGASRVLAYRFGGSAAAKSSRTLTNTDAGTPVALSLRAVYEGTRGDDLKVEVVANSADPTNKNDLVIYDGNLEIERYTHAKADVAALAADITARSNWVEVFGSTLTGFALSTTAVGGVAFTGGNDGSTLIAGDWTAALAAVEGRRFGIFVPYDLSDSAIVTTVKNWLADPSTGLNVKGKRVLGVFGGTLAGAGTPDSMANALTRADALANENLVVSGGYTVTDEEITDANGTKITLTAAQFAPRVAGVIAAKGEAQSATFGRLAGVDIVVGPTEAEVVQALEGGVIAIGKDSHTAAPVRLEKAVTTYQADTSQKPAEIYGVLKHVRVMQGLEMEITEFSENNIIGRLPVNDATREYLVGAASAMLRKRVDASIILPGYRVYIDQDPPPQPTDDFVALVYEITLARSLEQVRNTVVVS